MEEEKTKELLKDFLNNVKGLRMPKEQLADLIMQEAKEEKEKEELELGLKKQLNEVLEIVKRSFVETIRKVEMSFMGMFELPASQFIEEFFSGLLDGIEAEKLDEKINELLEKVSVKRVRAKKRLKLIGNLEKQRFYIGKKVGDFLEMHFLSKENRKWPFELQENLEEFSLADAMEPPKNKKEASNETMEERKKERIESSEKDEKSEKMKEFSDAKSQEMIFFGLDLKAKEGKALFENSDRINMTFEKDLNGEANIERAINAFFNSKAVNGLPVHVRIGPKEKHMIKETTDLGGKQLFQDSLFSFRYNKYFDSLMIYRCQVENPLPILRVISKVPKITSLKLNFV